MRARKGAHSYIWIDSLVDQANGRAFEGNIRYSTRVTNVDRL